MKSLRIVLILAFSTPVYAVGPTTIHGVNDSDERVELDEEWVPNRANPREGNSPTGFYVVLIKRNQEAVERFGGNVCHLASRSFTCAREGKSPLAGATYDFKKDLPNCRGSLFVCSSGCNARAPRAMIQDPWECPTLGANYYAACDRKNSKNKGVLSEIVNLRETPSPTALVLGRLNQKAKLTILERQSECLTINHESGQWIKVQAGEGSDRKTGWIFDAYVEYTDQL